MDENQIRLFSSKKSDDWGTPDWLYKKLDEEFHFDLDPCPLDPKSDGLDIPWFGNIFVNPPYSQVKKWLRKARTELDAGRAKLVVFLVFANTDTAWFHDYVLGKAEIRFLRGRLKFTGKQTVGHAAMRPSIVIIFRE